MPPGTRTTMLTVKATTTFTTMRPAMAATTTWRYAGLNASTPKAPTEKAMRQKPMKDTKDWLLEDVLGVN